MRDPNKSQGALPPILQRIELLKQMYVRVQHLDSWACKDVYGRSIQEQLLYINEQLHRAKHRALEQGYFCF